MRKFLSVAYRSMHRKAARSLLFLVSSALLGCFADHPAATRHPFMWSRVPSLVAVDQPITLATFGDDTVCKPRWSLDSLPSAGAASVIESSLDGIEGGSYYATFTAHQPGRYTARFQCGAATLNLSIEVFTPTLRLKAEGPVHLADT